MFPSIFSKHERMMFYEFMLLYFMENVKVLQERNPLTIEYNWGFCECIADIDGVPLCDISFRNFPELLENKPTDTYSDGWWFEPRTIKGQQDRVNLLQKILKDNP